MQYKKNYDIEDLPEAVKSKELSKKEAAKIIWGEIYTNPAKYGLGNFTEDQKSDFLLKIHPKFEKLFNKFLPGQVSFRTYISGCILNYKSAYLRNYFNKKNDIVCLESILKNDYEEDIYRYSLKIAESKPLLEKNSFDFDDLISKEKTNTGRRERIAKLTALVLLMKACTDIDDSTINSVSDFTGIDRELLYKSVEELKEKMEKRDENHQLLIKKRNNAFYFHRKYMQEMTAPSMGDERRKLLKKRYESQTKKWQESNKKLSDHLHSPSNEDIASVIGIRPRMVSFYINHAKKGKKNIFSRKGTSAGGENSSENINENINGEDYIFSFEGSR